METTMEEGKKSKSVQADDNNEEFVDWVLQFAYYSRDQILQQMFVMHTKKLSAEVSELMLSNLQLQMDVKDEKNNSEKREMIFNHHLRMVLNKNSNLEVDNKNLAFRVKVVQSKLEEVEISITNLTAQTEEHERTMKCQDKQLQDQHIKLDEKEKVIQEQESSLENLSKKLQILAAALDNIEQQERDKQYKKAREKLDAEYKSARSSYSHVITMVPNVPEFGAVLADVNKMFLEEGPKPSSVAPRSGLRSALLQGGGPEGASSSQRRQPVSPTTSKKITVSEEDLKE